NCHTSLAPKHRFDAGPLFATFRIATMRTSILAPTLLALAAPVLAQNLDLDKIGGGLGGLLECPIHGLPNEPYALLVDVIEQQTTLPALGITLDITDQLVSLTLSIPGFLGLTNSNGDATPTVPMPNIPVLQSLTLSMQAIAGSGPFRVSNLVRVTPQTSGTFKPALNAPSLPIAGGGVVAEDDGAMLFVGGSGPVATRYQSRIEEWELGGATFGVGLLSQTTPLADGRVLFTGGLDIAGGQPTDAAAIYDPATQTTTTLTMSSPRAGHGASQMGNGMVLITGGLLNFDLANPLTLLTGIQTSTEIFNPATGTFATGPNLLEARALHTSTTLTNGQVLIAGGITLLPIVSVPTVSSTAYLFNPASGNFGFPTFFNGARFLHSATALSNGKVLIAGGLSLDLTTFLTTLDPLDLVIGTRDDCLLYSTGFLFGGFTQVAGMQVGRAGAAIAPLPNGGALIAGGFQVTIDIANGGFVLGATETADVFSQGPNAIAPTGSMAAPRLFPVTANLPDGTIMVLGGGPLNAEIYQR
ncbi:MAG: hypothetical protein ACI89X_002113, partial [Planctomycetota bacterium]